MIIELEEIFFEFKESSIFLSYKVLNIDNFFLYLIKFFFFSVKLDFNVITLFEEELVVKLVEILFEF